MTDLAQRHTWIEHHKTRNSEHNLRRGNGRRRKLSKREVDSLLRLYRQSERTTDELARCYGVHASLVTYLAKQAGIPLRGHGVRPRLAPSHKAQELLLEAWTTTLAEAAARFGVSKQHVGYLVKRWKNWAIAQFGQRVITCSEPRGKQQHHCTKIVRPHVISFRVTDSELAELQAQRGKLPAPWVSSSHSAARFHLIRSLGLTPIGCANSQNYIGPTP